jgi:hypothetical protein
VNNATYHSDVSCLQQHCTWFALMVWLPKLSMLAGAVLNEAKPQNSLYCTLGGVRSACSDIICMGAGGLLVSASCTLCGEAPSSTENCWSGMTNAMHHDKALIWFTMDW